MRLVGILVTLLQASAVLSQGNFTQLQDEVEQDFPDGDTDNTDDKETSWTNDWTVINITTTSIFYH